jgi:glucose-1-phosphate adenylyltransferase
VEEATIKHALLVEGSVIGKVQIQNSVVGIRSRISDGVELDGALIMGNDFYQTETERAADSARGLPPVGIGESTVIRKAILDKNVRIGKNVALVNERGIENEDGANHYIRDGIVIVAKGATIPDGTVI